MLQFIIPIFSYLIGSLPTAYILTRRFSGKDLRKEGSRNIGTRNAYEVTQSRKVGILVLAIDVFKGLLPLLALDAFGYRNYIPIASALIIIGHCYPIFLRFHGGRGLATAAGILLFIEPFALMIWIQVYFFSSFFKRNVHVNAAIATLFAAVLTLITPEAYFFNIFYIPSDSIDFLLSLRVAILVITAVILIRHIEPLREFRNQKHT